MNLTSKEEFVVNGSDCHSRKSKAPVFKVHFFKGCYLMGINSECAVLFASTSCKIHIVHTLAECNVKFIICECILCIYDFRTLKYICERATMLNLELSEWICFTIKMWNRLNVSAHKYNRQVFRCKRDVHMKCSYEQLMRCASLEML